MSKERINTVVSSIVKKVREAILENDVTMEEYRVAIGFLAKVMKAGEIPLMVDVFFNTTVVAAGNKKTRGSSNDLQGPYYREDAPLVPDGKIKTMEEFGGEPMELRGVVKDIKGKPVAGALIDVWSSTPDGKYSGFHDNIPVEYYRGKQRTDSKGRYKFTSTVPVPYQIPHHGPTGELMRAMGRHTWRPAHVHYMIQADGYQKLVTQAYFEGGDYVGDDSCEGMHTDEFVMPKVIEDGKRIVDIDFVLDFPLAEQKKSLTSKTSKYALAFAVIGAVVVGTMIFVNYA